MDYKVFGKYGYKVKDLEAGYKKHLKEMEWDPHYDIIQVGTTVSPRAGFEWLDYSGEWTLFTGVKSALTEHARVFRKLKPEYEIIEASKIKVV